jgi:phospho-N-acetylmuramoyl-pentapeptide-transferase
LYYILYYWLSGSISWLNVFKYQTFRAMIAFLFSFAFVITLLPVFIEWLKDRGVKGQPIRNDGPKDHEIKRGTPTMGGAVMIVAIALAGLLFCDLSNLHVWLSLTVMLLFAGIGFVDDWRKVTQQKSSGLSERQKLLAQTVIALLVALPLIFTNFPLTLTIPVFKSVSIEWWIALFVIFVGLVVVGTSNAVNLTDGLDGLAIGSIMTVGCTYGIFCYISGHKDIAVYLQLTHIPYLGEVSIILSAMVAAGLGFLWYNTFPAQIFMGDTGALSLGGLIGYVAVLTKQELLLVVVGGVFVVEALSVIIQRYYYKLTKKRVFRMAPIHHHFELLGWVEPKIIVRFWIVSILLALLALTTLKLR